MATEELHHFSVSRFQVIDEHGEVDSAVEPPLEDDALLHMYRLMALARAGDERMLKLQRQGRIGTFAPCTGQEAAAVGPVAAMRRSDWYVPSFRELGGWLARGVPLWRTLLYHNGFEEGNVFDGVERTLPISVIVASQLLHAVGLAYAMRQLGEPETAVVTSFGEGATSQGDFHEALNFAALWSAPVVFVCQNNHWAISTPRARQTHSRTIAQKAIAYDMPGVQVDGNDVLAMYQATAEALDRAREGEGPTLIEAVTYRLLMHTTADDPSKYRSQDEVDAWWRREPLGRFRRYLELRGLWSTEQQSALEVEIKADVEDAVRRFESVEGLVPDAPFDHVFGTEHAVLRQQRQDFLTRLARGEHA